MRSPVAVVLVLGLVLAGCLDREAPPEPEAEPSTGPLEVPPGGLELRLSGSGWARLQVESRADTVLVPSLVYDGIEVNSSTPVIAPGAGIHVVFHPPVEDERVPPRGEGSLWVGYAADKPVEAPADWAIEAPHVAAHAARLVPGAPWTLWAHVTTPGLSFRLVPEDANGDPTAVDVPLVAHPDFVVLRPTLERRAVGVPGVEPDVQYTMAPAFADVARGHYFIRVSAVLESERAAGALQVWAGWVVGDHCLGGVHTAFMDHYYDRRGGAFWGPTEATSLELCASIGRTVVGDLEMRDAEALFAFVPYDAPSS